MKKHSEDLEDLKNKFFHLESALYHKKDSYKPSSYANGKHDVPQMKGSGHPKENHVWKLLTISEQSYLSLLNRLSEALQVSDLKGSTALMHSSWHNCEELADNRRLDHKKILQSVEKLKKSLRHLHSQENINTESKRHNVDHMAMDERKCSFVCYSEEMHFQHLCQVLQKAQETVVKEYYQKRGYQRTPVAAGSGRVSRQTGSREKKVPLELKNGKILALLDDKLSQKEILPNKMEYNKVEFKQDTAHIKNKSAP